MKLLRNLTAYGIILLISVVMLSGCSSNNNNNTQNSTPTPASSQQSPTPDTDSTVSSTSDPEANKIDTTGNTINRLHIIMEDYSHDPVKEYTEEKLSEINLPSKCMGYAEDRVVTRSCELQEIDWDKKEVKYLIKYPAYKMESVTTFSLDNVRAVKEDIFPKKYRITYEYKGEYTEDKGIPASYTVYEYTDSTGKYDKVLGKFTIVSSDPAKITYKDEKGTQIIRDKVYFTPLPQAPK